MRSCKLVTSEREILPPRSERIIQVHKSGKHAEYAPDWGVTEASFDTIRKHSVVAAQALVDSMHCVVPLRILNPTNYTVVLSRDTTVATLHPVRAVHNPVNCEQLCEASSGPLDVTSAGPYTGNVDTSAVDVETSRSDHG